MAIAAEEYARRFERVHEMMKRNRLRGLLVYSPHRDYRPAYLRWLTGWWTKEEESGILVITDSADPVIYMNGTSYRTGDIFRAKDTSYIKDVNPTTAYARDICAFLKKVGITHGRVGVAEWRVFPADIHQGLVRELSSVEWVDIFQEMNALTLIKSPAEIQLMRRANEITEVGTRLAVGSMKPGMTEHELLALAEYEARKIGAEISFISEVGSGVHRTWIGEPQPTDKRIEAGDLVLIDWGARWHGYHGDITRTVVMGEPSRKQREILDLVNESLLAGIDAIKPGVLASHLTDACFQVMKRGGYADYWNPAFIPHGIGIGLHEEPMLEPGFTDRPLEPAMIINLEPGLYIPDFGGVRLENTMLVTEHGHEVLNKYPSKLW